MTAINSKVHGKEKNNNVIGQRAQVLRKQKNEQLVCFMNFRSGSCHFPKHLK